MEGGSVPMEGSIVGVLPLHTHDSAHFWDTCAAHAMELQRCQRCSRFRYYPSSVCPYCSSVSFEWKSVSGRGTVYSFTWVLRAAPGFEDRVPYVYALVALEEGPFIATNIVDVLPDELAINLPVAVDYADVAPGLALPLFRPLPAKRSVEVPVEETTE